MFWKKEKSSEKQKLEKFWKKFWAFDRSRFLNDELKTKKTIKILLFEKENIIILYSKEYNRAKISIKNNWIHINGRT